MSLQGVEQLSFEFWGWPPIQVEVSAAPWSSDAGLIPIRQFDGAIRWTEQFAAALGDSRVAGLVRQPMLTMVRPRLYGWLADYEDQNDHDTLRSDPIFKLVCDRLPTGDDLASQPTLSRFENEVTIADLWRLRDVFGDLFLPSFDAPPARITRDLAAFDDPAHGQQQLVLFHGDYEQYQYLPIAITCAENDAVLLVGLRHGPCSAFLGADDDLRYLVGRLRAVWPDVPIHIRGDSGFGVPVRYAVCEELGLTYPFGLGLNAVLQRRSEPLLTHAVQQSEQTHPPQRLFQPESYPAGPWPCARQVVIKCEAHAQGTNRRAVVTNRAGGNVLPAAIYEASAERGESENRNQELKRGWQSDRLSEHRFLANFFRLSRHAAALNLLVRLRRVVARPATPRQLGVLTDLPAQALDSRQRKQFFNRRRDRDPLGEGHACTWRTRLIKVAACVLTSTRRIVVRLSGSWPHLDHFTAVTRAVLRDAPPPPTPCAPDSG